MGFLRAPFGLAGAASLALFLGACVQDARDRVPRRTTAAVETNLRAAPVAPQRPVDVCDSVAALWQHVAGVKVVRADTTITPTSATTPVRACRVAMDAPNGLPEGAEAKVYWADSWTGSTARGWRSIARWEAEGPDGFDRTFVRAGIRCQVDFEQDGGDDSDSTYVPSPHVTERTACWQDAAGVTVRDTAK